MAHTLTLSAPSLYAGTMLLKAFVEGNSASVTESVAATNGAEDGSQWSGTFSALSVGVRYRFVLFENGVPVAADWKRIEVASGSLLCDGLMSMVDRFSDQGKSEINAEVADVMSVDTFSELGAVPAATSSLADKLTWLFMLVKNRSRQTELVRELYADDNTTVVGTSSVADTGTVFTKGKEA